MSVVLGVNGLPAWHVRHDPGAALVIDGRVVAAVEEERLARVKRANGYAPVRAAREVLDLAKMSPSDVELIAYPWLPDAVDADNAEIAAALHKMLASAGLDVRAPVAFVEHHTAHAWSAMPYLPATTEPPKIVALVLDASGETTAGAAFHFGSDGGGPARLWNLAQRASLGAYYEAVTRFIGFGPGQEGKTMGLAPYGRTAAVGLPPLPDERFAGDLPARRDHPGLHAKSFADLLRYLIEAFAAGNPAVADFQARADLASAAEDFVAQRVLAYVTELLDDSDVDILTLSGGLALNCTINRRVAALCAARGVGVAIPPPASDTGVALGAAIAASHASWPFVPADAYLGRDPDPQAVAASMHDLGLAVESSGPELLAAELVERSALCGWYVGRAEIGPRALGARSVLARADSTAVRDRVNRVKSREAWRPLAPSMTAEEFARSCPGEHPSEHMLVGAHFNPASRERLAGVAHVDGSTRAQVVRHAGPYRDLIEQVGALSGTAAVMCTSFNRAGEPIVYSVQEAIASARTMGLDLLAGDGWLVRLHR
jgi:carbamoyltransferase